MGLRHTEGDEDAARRSRGIHGMRGVFGGVPMGLRPTDADEEHARRVVGRE